MIILIVTLVPGGTIDRFNLWGVLSFDKGGHFILYFVLSFLLIHTSFSTDKEWLSNGLYPKILVIASTFGAILELVQGTIPGRNFDIIDMIFNIAGSMAGLVAYYFFSKIKSGS